MWRGFCDMGEGTRDVVYVGAVWCGVIYIYIYSIYYILNNYSSMDLELCIKQWLL